jgi:hypothetical protein
VLDRLVPLADGVRHRLHVAVGEANDTFEQHLDVGRVEHALIQEGANRLVVLGPDRQLA